MLREQPGTLRRPQQCARSHKPGCGRGCAARRQPRPALAPALSAGHLPRTGPAGGPHPGAGHPADPDRDPAGGAAIHLHRSAALRAALLGADGPVWGLGAPRARPHARPADGRHQPQRVRIATGGGVGASPALATRLCHRCVRGGPPGRPAPIAGHAGHRRRRPLAAIAELAAGASAKQTDGQPATHRGRWPPWPQGGSGRRRPRLGAAALLPRQPPLAPGGAPERAPPIPLWGAARCAGGGPAQAALACCLATRC